MKYLSYCSDVVATAQNKKIVSMGMIGFGICLDMSLIANRKSVTEIVDP